MLPFVSGLGCRRVKVAFVESKTPDMGRVAELLKSSAAANAWANRGPVYRKLTELFEAHLCLPADRALVPVANGGVALEAMARLHAAKAGRKLRWVASAYSFQNLGRGYFADVTFVDCDAGGLLDAEALAALDPESWDGVVITNPFGLYTDFSAIAAVARRHGKAVIVDNAAGLHSIVSDLPWQAFSLHHTKPFGMGEGGLALVPHRDAEALYELVNYSAEIDAESRPHWYGNGKLSDISAAFLLDRLEQLPRWGAKSRDQRDRITALAARAGLTPLAAPQSDIPLTSMPFLAAAPVPLAAVDATRHATFAKYYRPLAPLPRVTDIFDRLVNIPCHPDMDPLQDRQILDDIEGCLAVTPVPPPRAPRPRPDRGAEDRPRDPEAAAGPERRAM